MNSGGELLDADADTLRLLIRWISKRVDPEIIEKRTDEFFSHRRSVSFDPDEALWWISEGCNALSEGIEHRILLPLTRGIDPADAALNLYLDLCDSLFSDTLCNAASLGRIDVVNSIIETVVSAPKVMDCELVGWMSPSYHLFTTHVLDCISSNNPESILGFRCYLEGDQFNCTSRPSSASM